MLEVCYLPISDLESYAAVGTTLSKAVKIGPNRC